MARETTSSTLDQVLLRVIDRLIVTVAEAKSANTYISTVHDEPAPNSDENMFEVAPSENSSFDDAHMEGAGKNALHWIGSIDVMIHATAQNDQVGRDVEFLTNASRGIIGLVTKVLDSLSNHDLLDADGNQMLSQPLRPGRMSIPPKNDRTTGYILVSFSCEFDWYMSTADPPVP